MYCFCSARTVNLIADEVFWQWMLVANDEATFYMRLLVARTQVDLGDIMSDTSSTVAVDVPSA